jgi:hypothetical protein
MAAATFNDMIFLGTIISDEDVGLVNIPVDTSKSFEARMSLGVAKRRTLAFQFY